MKRTICIFAYILAAAWFIHGCGGGGLDLNEFSDINAPEWYFNPAVSADAFYSVQTAVSRDFQMAVEKAKQQGRAEVALQIEARVKAMVKRFQEEIGLGEDSEFLDMATSVSKSVASTILNGCSVDKQSTWREPNGIYRAYVLMVLPLDSTKSSLYGVINSQQNLYTRFRASQSFKELEEEIEAFEEFKEQDLTH